MRVGRAGTRPRVAEGEVREDLPDDHGIVQRAIRRRRPPQLGHANTSMPNARCIRAAPQPPFARHIFEDIGPKSNCHGSNSEINSSRFQGGRLAKPQLRIVALFSRFARRRPVSRIALGVRGSVLLGGASSLAPVFAEGSRSHPLP